MVSKGMHAEMYQGKTMDLKGMSFLSLCFMNNVPLSRVAHHGEYITRIDEEEYRSAELKSISAIPICTHGSMVDLVISIESIAPRELSKHHIDLLMSIGSLAGFAISRARAFAKREQMATRDSLTGLYNLRAFKERFEEEIKRTKRTQEPLGILLLDIDHFKELMTITDTVPGIRFMCLCGSFANPN